MSAIETEINKKMERIGNQITQIKDKSQIALTRSRMLEIAQERNIFARKLYYTLIAFIIFILILTLYLYRMKR
jgi:hypothetical protein